MAHFAEIDSNNIVVRVLVISDEQESRGEEFLSVDLGLGGTWIQTSINTRGGVHILGGTPLRKNYAGEGYTYDSVKDAFIPPSPFPSWILDEESCLWNPPVEYPKDRFTYRWDEQVLGWTKIETIPQKPQSWIWNTTKQQWEPPIPYPTDKKCYIWNESIQNWTLHPENPTGPYAWSELTYSWVFAPQDGKKYKWDRSQYVWVEMLT